MMYIKSVDILSEYRTLKKKSIELKNITLLVGDQGCGKSTLLNLIQSNSDNLKISLSDEIMGKSISTYYFDSELMNPRTKDPQSYTTPSGENIGIGFGAALSSRLRSHGEVLKDFTIGALSNVKDKCIIFLDEPESSLSIPNQIKLSKLIIEKSKYVQFIISTHNYYLIKEVGEYYDLEEYCWKDSKSLIV